VSARRGDVEPEDFLLNIDFYRGKFRSADWLFVHRVVRVEKKERAYDGSGYQAVQVYPRRACPPPPFAIDRAFRRALKAVDWEAYGLERPPKNLLRDLANHHTKG
jgi:hypothetical protein